MQGQLEGKQWRIDQISVKKKTHGSEHEAGEGNTKENHKTSISTPLASPRFPQFSVGFKFRNSNLLLCVTCDWQIGAPNTDMRYALRNVAERIHGFLK